jgi:hypothetical protein
MHVKRIVLLSLILSCARLPRLFADEATIERVLIPLSFGVAIPGAYGSLWTMEFTGRNDGDTPLLFTPTNPFATKRLAVRPTSTAGVAYGTTFHCNDPETMQGRCCQYIASCDGVNSTIMAGKPLWHPVLRDGDSSRTSGARRRGGLQSDETLSVLIGDRRVLGLVAGWRRDRAAAVPPGRAEGERWQRLL